MLKSSLHQHFIQLCFQFMVYIYSKEDEPNSKWFRFTVTVNNHFRNSFATLLPFQLRLTVHSMRLNHNNINNNINGLDSSQPLHRPYHQPYSALLYSTSAHNSWVMWLPNWPHRPTEINWDQLDQLAPQDVERIRQLAIWWSTSISLNVQKTGN